jgi:hypothetical protein
MKTVVFKDSKQLGTTPPKKKPQKNERPIGRPQLPVPRQFLGHNIKGGAMKNLYDCLRGGDAAGRVYRPEY